MRWTTACGGNISIDAKVTVLIENVRHHVEEEESELFPQLRERLDAEVLAELADAIATAKEVAPTRAHPHAADEPPANVANLVTGMVDRARDKVRAAARG